MIPDDSNNGAGLARPFAKHSRLWRVATKWLQLVNGAFRSRVLRLIFGLCVVVGALLILARNSVAIGLTISSLNVSLLLSLSGLHLVSFLLWYLAWVNSLKAQYPIEWKRDLRIYSLTTLFRNIPLGAQLWNFIGRPAEYVRSGLDPVRIYLALSGEVFAQVLSGSVVALAFLAATMIQGRFLPTTSTSFTPAIALLALPSVVIIACLFWAYKQGRIGTRGIVTQLRRSLVSAVLVSPSWLVATIMLRAFMAEASSNQFSIAEIGAAWTLSSTAGILLGFLPVPTRGLGELSLAYQLGARNSTDPIVGQLIVFLLVLSSLEIMTSLLVLAALGLASHASNRATR